jgi:uncharacterized sulfatase
MNKSAEYNKVFSFVRLIAGICFTLLLSASLSAAPPNVVLVFVDDMGWGGFSCFGNKAVKMPKARRWARFMRM